MKTPKIVFWKSEIDGLWYWQAKAANGRIVCRAATGRKSKPKMFLNIGACRRALRDGVGVEIEG